MNPKYFVGEIDIPDGKIQKELIWATDITEAHDIIERKIKNLQTYLDSNPVDRSFWLPYRPVGSFIVRHATTKEILENSLKDFAHNWSDYSIPGFAEEVVDIVLSTIPKKALEEELQKRGNILNAGQNTIHGKVGEY